MRKQIIEASMMLALPISAFVVGSWLMLQISGRNHAELPPPSAKLEDLRPLGLRLGYGAGDAERHWGALGAVALPAEKRFLQLDLAFPLFFGAALAFSLVMAWNSLGRPFNPAWLLAPVLLGVLADWAENLTQLGQIEAYRLSGAGALRADRIRVASAATTLKLLSFGAASLALLLLIGVKFVRALRGA